MASSTFQKSPSTLDQLRTCQAQRRGGFARQFSSGHRQRDRCSCKIMAQQQLTLNQCWSQITQTEYPGPLPTADPGALPSSKLLFPPYNWPTLTHSSDIVPPGRLKLIHTYGAIAKINFEITDARFSGLFESGGEGVARMSLARMQQIGAMAFTPALAIKMFVKDATSVNFTIMYKLDGQGDDRNCFSNPFTNILPPPVSAFRQALAGSFGVAVCTVAVLPKDKPEGPGKLPLLEAAQITAGGIQVPEKQLRVPYKIIFAPTDDARNQYEPHKEGDFRDALGQIKDGTVLYTILATDRSLAPDSEAVEIGKVKMASKFIASEFGDRQLFFKHMKDRDMSLYH